MGELDVILVRHGESIANAGAPTVHPATIPLTMRGHLQSCQIAARFQFSPTLIVVSPYLRAQQTAQPTIERFPMVPVEQWQVHEFTYLEPSRHARTNMKERQVAVKRYWQTADPEYRDGLGAESFLGLLQRVEHTLTRLSQFPSGSRIVIFTHRQWIQALRLSILQPRNTPPAEKMAQFLQYNRLNVVRNASILHAHLNSKGAWALDQDK